MAIHYKVRWHPQYCNRDNPQEVTNYRVYAFVEHPCYPIIGTEISIDTEYGARKVATLMRKNISLALQY